MMTRESVVSKVPFVSKMPEMTFGSIITGTRNNKATKHASGEETD